MRRLYPPSPERMEVRRTSYGFLHARYLERGRPGIDWIREVPSNVVVATFGTQGEKYMAYLADSGEVHEPGCGEPIAGVVKIGEERRAPRCGKDHL